MDKKLRQFIKQRVREEVNKTLSPREQAILYMRFGLGNDKINHTLEEVGKEFGITRERVRQIEAKAMDKIDLSYDSLKKEIERKIKVEKQIE